VQVVRLAREMGRVMLGTLAVDGSKVRAHARLHQVMSDGHVRQVDAE
jgi:hypothetical protein